MYNTCNFNSIKFDSVCLRAILEIEEVTGGIRISRRKRKVLYKQFFDIVGTKLIFDRQIFNLLGLLLLAYKYNYPIDAQAILKVQEKLELVGYKKSFKTFKQELIAFKKFLKYEKIDIKLLHLFLTKINYEINGIKLSNKVFHRALEGQKSFAFKDKQKIYGEKDIQAIIEALDLLDFKE